MSALSNILSPRAKLVVQRATELQTGKKQISEAHALSFVKLVASNATFATNFNEMVNKSNVNPNTIDELAKSLNASVSD